MAKKTKKSNQSSVDNVVKKVNKEYEKTSARIEKLINDALKQLDGLQSQVKEPVRKLQREFNELQSSFLERIGIASKEAKEEVKKATEKAADKPAGKAKAKKTSTKKPAAKKNTGTKAKAAKSGTTAASAKKATAAKKPAAAKPATAKRSAKPVDKADLTRIKGIGPVTAKKMNDAGITSVDQIANPSEADKEKLQAFSTLKGFSTFTDEAKKLS